MKPLLIGLLYIGIWASAGALCGFSARYSKTAEKKGPPYWKAWIVNAVTIAMCLVIVVVIHDIDRSKLVDEVYGWIGPVLAALIFIALLVRVRYRKS